MKGVRDRRFKGLSVNDEGFHHFCIDGLMSDIFLTFCDFVFVDIGYVFTQKFILLLIGFIEE